MNEALALAHLSRILSNLNRWGSLYDRRWGKIPPYHDNDGLDAELRAGMDEVRADVGFARDVVAGMGEVELAGRMIESSEGFSHSFSDARKAIVEAVAVLQQREQLAAIIGHRGPQLSASELHQTVWGAASGLWNDGYLRSAVQTAATALEGMLQGVSGPNVSGENLGGLFSVAPPTIDFPRLRIRDVDPQSKTWRSAHEGAAAMVRGAFLAVRNLVSHPGWPDPTPAEAFEMICLLSYVARLVDRSEKVAAP